MDKSQVFSRLTRLEPPFPRAEAEEARRRWDEWGTDFIDLIVRVAEGGEPFLTDQEGEERFDGRFAFACWLAAEKRDARAYRPLARAARCPEKRADEIFGDDITEGLPRWLAASCDGDLEPILSLAEDECASPWSRNAALEALAIRVVEGELERKEAVSWLIDFSRREAEWLRRHSTPDGNHDLVLAHAVRVLGDLGPAEYLDEIRGWFAEDFIDPGYIDFDYFAAQARRPVAECLDALRDDPHRRYVRDALAEMAWWPCFEEEAPSAPRSVPDWLEHLVPGRSAERCFFTGSTYQRKTPKVGRNDPCPCGSGKKFKKCCGREVGEQPAGADAGATAVRRALNWLAIHHSDKITLALYNRITQGLEDDEIDALDTLAPDDWNNIRTNLLEWLLAEGELNLIAPWRPFSVRELLLGANGPGFTDAERAWIEALGSQPLSLYTVTQVAPGEAVTLVDDLDPVAAPFVVHEKAGSRLLRPGMRLAARVISFEGRNELSGCLHLYNNAFIPGLMNEIEAVKNDHDGTPERLAREISAILFRHWLRQYLRPAPLPSLIDYLTGEPLLLITDHYRVRDWAQLEATLAQASDIDGDRAQGWKRIVEGEDGAVRTRLSINPVEDKKDAVEVLYRTRTLAEEGRPWFEALAGASVEFIARETHDPKVDLMLASMVGKTAEKSKPVDLPPEVKADLIEEVLRRHYANWADEPIPALGHKTPRQAITTPAGLERVKALLRSYAEGEEERAAKEGRRPISYDFLWRSIGLDPE